MDTNFEDHQPNPGIPRRMTKRYARRVRLRIDPHALTHGLSEHQIVAAYETGANGAVVRSRDAHTEPPRWAVIGFDDQARQIQLLFVRLTGEELLIFHAQYLTKAFRAEVKQAHEHLRKR